MKPINYFDFEYWKMFDPDEPELHVSNLGRVCRIVPSQEYPYDYEKQIIEPQIDKYGYMYVTIGHCRICSKYIHRMVAILFCNPEWLIRGVRHVDGDKTNNTPYNLKWVAEWEKMQYARACDPLFI